MVKPGYYGSVSHNVKATYVYYLGWFDGNPATLDELPPEQAAKKFVEYMGGAGNILSKAKEDYRQGNYRWVAQVTSKVVFADPQTRTRGTSKRMRWSSWATRRKPAPGVTSTSPARRSCVTACRSCQRRTLPARIPSAR
ncbi:Uncharacterised protein [Raoultella terrigena]|uniref:Alkyl sulfatase dimerisation domain-containing protein n=1 Tax=Raoultella terrigena TaxID=577 RepID=A0A4U9CYM5_RAOTE|nr:Uncharacterised protein [Raoultella terrigena]